MKLISAIAPVAVLATTALLAGCVNWHVTSLEPSRFGARHSPKTVRLTLADGTKVPARHPVIVGDSLVWTERRESGDSERTAIGLNRIAVVEVRRPDYIGFLLV